MEKLINLANQYVEEKGMKTRRTEDKRWNICGEGEGQQISRIILISKNYWFIARLVYNELIDREKVKLSANRYREDESPVYNKMVRYERLLMILSVSIRPEEILYYILK